MLILAAAKIWLTVIIFQGLSSIYDTVEGWIRNAFNNPNLSEPFHLVEVAFRCCGVNGPDSYIGVYPAIPPTCCANPTTSDNTGTCAREDSFDGCANIVADYFEVFGDVVGVILITIIIVELVAMIFGLYLSNTITNNKRGYA
ncbi:tetraspanin-18B-like [Choristoneura fumiferana]